MKQIESFERLIHEHKNKIEKERAKPIPDTGLIKYWEREINVYTDEIYKKYFDFQHLRREYLREIINAPV